MLPAIILFALTYVLMLTFSKYRPYIALISGVLFIVTGMLPLGNIIPSLDFGLLSGATLGGNCTPIGASANITGIGILRRDGHEVQNRAFFRIGILFTLAAVIPAFLYFWFVFA